MRQPRREKCVVRNVPILSEWVRAGLAGGGAPIKSWTARESGIPMDTKIISLFYEMILSRRWFLYGGLFP